MVTASIATHTDAFIAALAAGTGLPIGDHVGLKAPPNGLAPAPHCVVYLIPGGLADGPLCDPQADIELLWQVTSIGRVAREARHVADKVRATAVGLTLEVDARFVWPIRLSSSSPRIDRDDDVQPPLFYCVDRFVTTSSPLAMVAS